MHSYNVLRVLYSLFHDDGRALMPGPSRTIDQLELVEASHQNAGLETCSEAIFHLVFLGVPEYKSKH
jgi:hypothetical protein